MASGIEVNKDVLFWTVVGPVNETIYYDGTRLLKKEGIFCLFKLEDEFSSPSYCRLPLFRGNNRSLRSSVGRPSFFLLKKA